MAKYIVAVSGGVDSVVLLDILSRSEHTLIVAHVEHGIRGEESVADARFVEALARQYNLPFVSKQLGLGPSASEERARELRYAFLFSLATEHQATVVTAHHADDVVETIALNIQRGTGWRGLTVLTRAMVHRPLIGMTKAQLYDYAVKARLEWVEDVTNASDAYQRNRLRHKIAALLSPASRRALMDLRARQLSLRDAITREAAFLLRSHRGSRHFLAQLDEGVALELLGRVIEDEIGIRPTRPQLIRALIAVKAARPGSEHHVGNKTALHFTVRKYRVAVV